MRPPCTVHDSREPLPAGVRTLCSSREQTDGCVQAEAYRAAMHVSGLVLGRRRLLDRVFHSGYCGDWLVPFTARTICIVQSVALMEIDP